MDLFWNLIFTQSLSKATNGKKTWANHFASFSGCAVPWYIWLLLWTSCHHLAQFWHLQQTQNSIHNILWFQRRSDNYKLIVIWQSLSLSSSQCYSHVNSLCLSLSQEGSECQLNCWALWAAFWHNLGSLNWQATELNLKICHKRWAQWLCSKYAAVNAVCYLLLNHFKSQSD